MLKSGDGQLVEALNTILKTCVATRNGVDREASSRPGDATQANARSSPFFHIRFRVADADLVDHLSGRHF